MADLATPDFPVVAALMLIAGGCGGVLAGLLGVGGGIVLVPAFFYVFQWAGHTGAELMQMCVATSLATIVPTSARSVWAHHRKGTVNWHIIRTWAPGLAGGALAGAWTARWVASDTLAGIFAGLVLVVAFYMARPWRGQLGQTMPAGAVRAVQSCAVGGLSVLMGIGALCVRICGRCEFGYGGYVKIRF